MFTGYHGQNCLFKSCSDFENLSYVNKLKHQKSSYAIYVNEIAKAQQVIMLKTLRETWVFLIMIPTKLDHLKQQQVSLYRENSTATGRKWFSKERELYLI